MCFPIIFEIKLLSKIISNFKAMCVYVCIMYVYMFIVLRYGKES